MRKSKVPGVDCDFEINRVGSTAILVPITQRAGEWAAKNLALEGWQWIHGGIYIEPRMIGMIYDRAKEDGLRFK